MVWRTVKASMPQVNSTMTTASGGLRNTARRLSLSASFCRAGGATRSRVNSALATRHPVATTAKPSITL